MRAPIIPNMLIAALAGVASLAGVAALPGIAVAQEVSRVAFAPGGSSATLEAMVTGDAYTDYLLGASAGQRLSVSLIAPSDGPTPYFNVLPPGSDGVAVYVGSTSGNDATVPLDESGDYAVRVYLLGAARDEGRTIPYRLSLSVE